MLKRLNLKFDKKVLFIAIVLTLAVIYYINPLANIDVSSWDNTIGEAVLSGISIEKRIRNIYIYTYAYHVPFV